MVRLVRIVWCVLPQASYTASSFKHSVYLDYLLIRTADAVKGAELKKYPVRLPTKKRPEAQRARFGKRLTVLTEAGEGQSQGETHG